MTAWCGAFSPVLLSLFGLTKVNNLANQRSMRRFDSVRQNAFYAGACDSLPHPDLRKMHVLVGFCPFLQDCHTDIRSAGHISTGLFPRPVRTGRGWREAPGEGQSTFPKR